MFQLTVPSITFDIDRYKYDQHVDIYTELYWPQVSEVERKSLFEHETYMRFVCFQDKVDSKAYMYAYCRRVSDMMEQVAVPDGFYLVEICYVTKAYYFIVEQVENIIPFKYI